LAMASPLSRHTSPAGAGRAAVPASVYPSHGGGVPPRYGGGMRRWLALVAAALLALPGCASPEPEPVVTPSSPTVEPTTEQPEDVTWPLTGVALSDPDLARTSPVIGVKVENSGPARPWVGLAAADLVFVEMVEGGMT